MILINPHELIIDAKVVCNSFYESAFENGIKNFTNYYNKLIIGIWNVRVLCLFVEATYSIILFIQDLFK